MISFQEAIEKLCSSVTSLGSERVALQSAWNRVLAEDIHAPQPMPPFSYSAMDGYAIHTDDLIGAGPWTLPISGESAAGRDLPPRIVGTACRIFTGARLPQNTNAILPQENVSIENNSIVITYAPKPGSHIRQEGEDLAQGTIALSKGSRLTAGKIALAAALDRATLLVGQQPVVSILCSGDELRAPGSSGRPGSIPESNGYFVAAEAKRIGAIVRLMPYVPDNLSQATEAVRKAISSSDLVLTIGGVSVGDHDIMRQAFEQAGVTLDFWKVAIKPGKPLAVGHVNNVNILGLPGNPSAASLTFLLFAAPIIRLLQQDQAPIAPRFCARITREFRRQPGRQEFLRARLDFTHGEIRAHLFDNQASGAVTSFAEADALVVVPQHLELVQKDQLMEVIRIADF